MNSLKTLLTTITLTAVTAGTLLVAQTSATPHRGELRSKMFAALNLTNAQKQQAKSIFAEARTEAQPVRQALHQERQATQAAIKAGKSPSDVQAMAQNEGQQLAQLAGIHAAAMAKFNAILTPDQQQKLAAMHSAHAHKAGPPSATN